MKKTTLNFLGKNKTLFIEKSEYCSNGKTYYGLYDKHGELFSDVTTNFDWLLENEYAINSDFVNCCFDNEKSLYNWIKDNFAITSYGLKNGYYVFTL